MSEEITRIRDIGRRTGDVVSVNYSPLYGTWYVSTGAFDRGWSGSGDTLMDALDNFNEVSDD